MAIVQAPAKGNIYTVKKNDTIKIVFFDAQIPRYFLFGGINIKEIIIGDGIKRLYENCFGKDFDADLYMGYSVRRISHGCLPTGKIVFTGTKNISLKVPASLKTELFNNVKKVINKPMLSKHNGKLRK